MATQIGWKELEERVKQSEAAVKTQSCEVPKQTFVPLYVCWPPEDPTRGQKESGLGKTFAVMAGILVGGLVLGILMARFLLPW